MKIEQAEALDLICYYAKEHLKDDKIMSQSIDIAKDIIKKALREGEDLDTIKEVFSQYGLEYKLTLVREALLLLKQYQGTYGVRGQALITKKLKALEIIKEKMVDARALIEILEDEWTWEQYMDEEDDRNTGGHQFSRDRLTQEEYDLLKEVLDL